MTRRKNAIRRHLVSDYDTASPDTPPTEEEYFELAKWITDIEDASDENVEDYADYAGDGTPKSEVISVKEAYDVTGTYDPTDEAQELIAGKKRLIGDGRKVWHKIISADGTQQAEGVATLSAIVAGSGNAADFEAFGCNIAYDTIPEVTEVPVA